MQSNGDAVNEVKARVGVDLAADTDAGEVFVKLNDDDDNGVVGTEDRNDVGVFRGHNIVYWSLLLDSQTMAV